MLDPKIQMQEMREIAKYILKHHIGAPGMGVQGWCLATKFLELDEYYAGRNLATSLTENTTYPLSCFEEVK